MIADHGAKEEERLKKEADEAKIKQTSFKLSNASANGDNVNQGSASSIKTEERKKYSSNNPFLNDMFGSEILTPQKYTNGKKMWLFYWFCENRFRL